LRARGARAWRRTGGARLGLDGALSLRSLRLAGRVPRARARPRAARRATRRDLGRGAARAPRHERGRVARALARLGARQERLTPRDWQQGWSGEAIAQPRVTRPGLDRLLAFAGSEQQVADTACDNRVPTRLDVSLILQGRVA